LIGQPKTPKKEEILFVREEVEKIERQLGRRGIPHLTLIDATATVSGVLESMERFSCIHLACHASQHPETPLRSSIHLDDGPLKLSEIVKKNLHNVDFSFLSACQTSMGDVNLSEEVVHLASGMLAAGYRSVVGTMWSVFDEHGPDVAESFYGVMLEDEMNEGSPRVDGRRAARALHQATKELRGKISDSSYSFLAWVPYVHIGI
jgi:CHAT domain-containing protein